MAVTIVPPLGGRGTEFIILYSICEMLEQYDVVLASKSPRRQQLLSQLGIKFRVELIEGIQETVATLQEAGMKCVIISGGIDLAANMLANEFGFDAVAADSLEMDENGLLTGEGVKVVDLQDKSIWVRKFIEQYGTTPERTVSIGNSFTDIPMFKATGFSIAINADEYTEAAATVKLKTDNFADILDLIFDDRE